MQLVDSVSLTKLIQKYSKPGPRYTSYPTVPEWSTEIRGTDFINILKKENGNANPLSLYFHIPFCESLCYYCGCNIKITKDKSRGLAYVQSLLKEMETVASCFKSKREVSQISWGGGTPTFLSVNEMAILFEGIKKYFTIQDLAEISIEVDPRVTTKEQFSWFKEVGFNRISLGIQDFSPETQKAINRIQSVAEVKDLLDWCRMLGFKGINFDLIYGLPHQTLGSFKRTLQTIINLSPDRIAFYHYAHLPKMILHQKILDPLPMPSSQEKSEIFSLAVNQFSKAGYELIGMDHFALKTDELYVALKEKSLYRNFMGYTVKKASDMIGFGVSAISEVGGGFFQNDKEVKSYEEKVNRGELATSRGIFLTEEDKKRKWIIQALMCQFYLGYEEYEERFKEKFSEKFSVELLELKSFAEEKSLSSSDEGIEILPQGRIFLRNIAMIFDEYLRRPKGFKQFSSTV